MATTTASVKKMMPSVENHLGVNEILSEELSWSEKTILQEVRDVLSRKVGRVSGVGVAKGTSKQGSKKVQKKVDQSSENSPGKMGAMRKKFLADQRKATLSKNKEKETGIDPLMKEKLKVKEKNRGMIKSEQCGENGSSYKECSSPKDDVKAATTATLQKPPRRDAPKKLVVQEENLPKEVQQEDAMEAAEERRKERGASRRSLELMEKTV
ncbi:OLC1v1016115C1 [Oldenlandia corymbosa var. corymbosa]|uniref:OLC1v1016115C1 n=1 Tax=Oldenlandia corymbosa var. corymbosa TaxID=529605 RepID=A0AAV1E6J3_OLDCO|nr:OLC1v1016115C1 [Oldenlandia corymbosa var. corymbosa]